MPRRKTLNAADRLLATMSLVPWWANLALAIGLYTLLHAEAGRTAYTGAAVPPTVGMAHAVFDASAAIGQYLLPVICLIGAGLSLWRKRSSTRTPAAPAGPAPALDRLGRREVRVLLQQALQLQGYQPVDSGAAGHGDGIDLILRKERETVLLQCKEWKVRKVGVESICALYAMMVSRGAGGGIVVTTGRFSREAASFASGSNIHLIDGRMLPGLLGRLQPGR